MQVVQVEKVFLSRNVEKRIQIWKKVQLVQDTLFAPRSRHNATAAAAAAASP